MFPYFADSRIAINRALSASTWLVLLGEPRMQRQGRGSSRNRQHDWYRWNWRLFELLSGLVVGSTSRSGLKCSWSRSLLAILIVWAEPEGGILQHRKVRFLRSAFREWHSEAVWLAVLNEQRVGVSSWRRLRSQMGVSKKRPGWPCRKATL